MPVLVPSTVAGCNLGDSCVSVTEAMIFTLQVYVHAVSKVDCLLSSRQLCALSNSHVSEAGDRRIHALPRRVTEQALWRSCSR
jgi:hypothetical protein